MRTPEVEAAMSYRNGPLSCVLTMSDGSKRYGHEILAAEVERLEKREKELEADLDAYAPPVLQDGGPIFDSFGSKLRRDVRARAEAAEARVKELEAQVEYLTTPPFDMPERVEWKPECRSFYVYGPDGKLLGNDHPVFAVVKSVRNACARMHGGAT